MREVRGIALILLVSLAFLPSLLYAGTNASQHAVLDSIAKGGSGAGWTPLSGQQLYEVYSNAESYLSNYTTYHLPDGLSADIKWTSFNRTAVTGYDGLGDSAAWTGHYLAGQALKYAVTADAAILTQINSALDKIDILSRVSGRDGFIARHAIPYSTLVAAGSPYHGYYANYGGTTGDPDLGVRAFHGEGAYSDYVWLGNSSRDVLDGVNFGLATTYKYVTDSAIRARVAGLVERINDRWMNDTFLFWNVIDDGQGNSTLMNTACATSLLRTAATVNPGKYQSDYESYANGLGTGSTINNNLYHGVYVNNLNFIRTYVLNALETDPTLKAKWETKISNMWADAANQLNAHFAAIYLAGTGDTSDMRAVAAVQGSLADFPEGPRFDQHTINSTRTDIEIITVDNELVAKYALPIEDRMPDDFMWQRSAFRLDGGSSTSHLEYPGIDVFLPYWMGRESGAISDIPEPSSVLLLSVCMLAGGMVRRRRRKS